MVKMSPFILPSAPSYLLRASKKMIRPSRFSIPAAAWYSKHDSLFRTRAFSTGSKILRDPLRVLFCGSDSFSQASLDALIKEHKCNPELIQSIDVAVRPLKPVGRGMKQLAPKGPMHTLAEQHNLPLHEIDTFTGWNPPQYPVPINLIIAVSFGLFVPPRILRAAEYGGLNVHPSLLPDLRGPAPLHHAILSRDTHTGVSLQTLSDKTFDAGAVLAQTPLPGILIDPSWDVQTLTQRLANIGADMLIRGLREGVYIAPHIDVCRRTVTPRHAPKLEKFDYQIQWDSWTASDATIRSTKLQEKLWTSVYNKKGQTQRWTMEGVEEVDPEDPSSWTEEMKTFARHMKRQKERRQDAAWSPFDGSETPEEDNIANLNTLVFRQSIQRPPKRKKSRSIFNSSTEASKVDTTTTTTTQKEEKEKETTLPNTLPSTIDFRLPYFLDNRQNSQSHSQSIIIPLPRGGFLRIRKITVEGKKEQPAAIVAEQYKQKTTSPSNDENTVGKFFFDILTDPFLDFRTHSHRNSFSASGVEDIFFSWLEDINPFDM